MAKKLRMSEVRSRLQVLAAKIARKRKAAANKAARLKVEQAAEAARHEAHRQAFIRKAERARKAAEPPRARPATKPQREAFIAEGLRVLETLTPNDRIPIEAFIHYPTATVASGVSLRAVAGEQAREAARVERWKTDAHTATLPVLVPFTSLRGREPGRA